VLSVVTYGRNDNYGFNLYKRTAFGFNCIAETLTDQDEILFVDYNTPRHLPTLPEFIWDTLTEKALRLLKVIRISPEIHERIKRNSPLKILENVARNAAIVRSNPQSHWILSTNPDVLLVLASKWPSLGALLQHQPDSFYEMPRFDIPESVWSALPRSEPQNNLHLLRDWLVHNQAAIAETVPDSRFQQFLLFDAPGDFQLAPRDYFLRLRGFDESMNRYLHSDSNLAKRMWLLNGKRTDHLLGHLWVLHQDHYLSGEWANNVGTIVHNDYHAKVRLQSEIQANDESWGLQRASLPTFSLAQRAENGRRFFSPLSVPVNGDLPLSREVDWRLQPLYKLCHYEPQVISLYVRELLQVLPPESSICYLGKNSETLKHIRRHWHGTFPEARTVTDFCSDAVPAERVTPDVLLVDCYYDRSDEWNQRLQVFQGQLQNQVAKGRISTSEMDEELSRFTDSSDEQQLLQQLSVIWEKYLGCIKPRPGIHIVLIGCNNYAAHFFTFQETFARLCVGRDQHKTLLSRWHQWYQKIKVRLQVDATPNVFLKAAWGLRLLKRRVFRQFTGHESLMGYLYFSHFMRIRGRLLKTLNLRTLYVHHRLVIMRLES
jgi:hypothetical protein